MISIIIPIFNEAENLPLLRERLTAASPAWRDDYEIVLVDDGSTDESSRLMRAMAEEDAHFTIVTLSRNFGHQAAVSAGLQCAKGDAVVIMDGDLQDPPEELHRFLDKWREGYHVVYAIRRNRKENVLKRAAYASFYRILQAISDIHIPLDSGDFCVMDRRVVNVVNNELPEQIRFVRGLRAYAGFRQIGVAYDRAGRAAGESKYTFRKLMKLALDGIFGFSTFPLRIATYLGFFISLTSFAVAAVYLFARFFDIKILGRTPGDVGGFATLAVGMFFLGGITLTVLGVIGEYVGRIYLEVKRRPQYIVDSVYAKPVAGKAHQVL
ncbi:glycosyltransferase family 2 protein [bacterium]|nr:glycosyltransferase family 2 protein [bacterium]